MGFPDSFKIPVSDTQAYKQFGNSVVVPLVEAIAKKMINSINNYDRQDIRGKKKLEYVKDPVFKY
jgi:DNA (cytosine-5)-methyltransferase 1